MFEKYSFIELKEIVALNTPKLQDYIVDQNMNVEDLNNTLIVLASNNTEKQFDLESEIKSHPDSLFVKCLAIVADTMNDNGDYFSKQELIKAYPTFVGVPVFTNHENKDINQAKGKVIHSWWDESKNGIMIIAMVDAVAYPQLARGIKKEYVTHTSMGCSVKFSLCSVCHNFATVPAEYCTHIKDQKTRTLSIKKAKCNYHKNGNAEECPICKSSKSDPKTYPFEGKAFEYNYDVRFIENSFVTNPAFHDCGVREVIDPSKFLAKVAAISAILPQMLKVASETDIICTDKSCIKLAGQKEINDLNQALTLLTTVSQAMLEQKDQIDLEFLSDLVKVLSDLQSVTDELTEQGYGRLQSPSGEQPAPNTQQPTQQVPPATTEEVTRAVNPTPGGGSKIQSGSAGSVGTVTQPTASTKIQLQKLAINRKQLDLKKLAFSEKLAQIKKTLNIKHDMLIPTPRLRLFLSLKK